MSMNTAPVTNITITVMTKWFQREHVIPTHTGTVLSHTAMRIFLMPTIAIRIEWRHRHNTTDLPAS